MFSRQIETHACEAFRIARRVEQILPYLLNRTRLFDERGVLRASNNFGSETQTSRRCLLRCCLIRPYELAGGAVDLSPSLSPSLPLSLLLAHSPSLFLVGPLSADLAGDALHALRCMEGVWRVYGGCTEGERRVYGGCTEGARRVYGGCTEGVRRVV